MSLSRTALAPSAIVLRVSGWRGYPQRASCEQIQARRRAHDHIRAIQAETMSGLSAQGGLYESDAVKSCERRVWLLLERGLALPLSAVCEIDKALSSVQRASRAAVHADT